MIIRTVCSLFRKNFYPPRTKLRGRLGMLQTVCSLDPDLESKGWTRKFYRILSLHSLKMESPAGGYNVFTACPRGDVMRSPGSQRWSARLVFALRIESTQIQTWGDDEAFCRSTPDVEGGCAGGGVV
ncbi:hypothetical protein RRG08_062773 [Elysia crispata]|uniref:Uncharacterized protein n=1 Tax=Elysia crispata TaxID=231223 RepID=A0AAE0Y4B8_9GAST|nr:hypothetical protein RRG08_062773 [Elysia crispata]